MTAGCVAVIVPVYRAERFVAAALGSALAQPETGEVVVVDDGCTDGSIDVCRQLAREHPGRVRVVAVPGGVNRGPAAARNLGVATARLPLVAFLDADDVLLAGRFACSVPLLADDPRVDGVYEAVAQVRFEGSSPSPDALAAAVLATVDPAVAPGDLLARLLAPVPGTIHPDGLLLRRRALAEVGGFDESLRLMEDSELLYRLAAATTLIGGRTDRPVAVYRQHAAMTTQLEHPEFEDAPFRAALAACQWMRGRRDVAPHQRRLLRRLLCHNIGLWRGGDIGFWQLRAIQLRRWFEAARHCPEVLFAWRIWLHGLRFRRAPIACTTADGPAEGGRAR